MKKKKKNKTLNHKSSVTDKSHLGVYFNSINWNLDSKNTAFAVSSKTFVEKNNFVWL